MSELEIVAELSKYGLAGVFIAYLIFINQKRDKEHAKERKEEAEKWRGWIKSQNEQNTKQMDEVKEVIKSIAPALNSVENIIIELRGKLL